MSKTRFLCSELLSTYQELSTCYDKKIDRIQNLQEEVEKTDYLKYVYHDLAQHIDHHI